MRKRNAAGEIECFRARLVAEGFLQRPGVEYDEVYVSDDDTAGSARGGT